MMTIIPNKTNSLLLLVSLLVFSLQSFAQSYNNLDYECLEMPFEFLELTPSNIHITCTAGEMRMDTLEDDCYDIYEEDGNIMRGWYYLAPDQNEESQFFFEQLSLHEDDVLEGQVSKYFECQRAGIWYLFYQPGNSVQKLSLRARDISGEGINFGLGLPEGPVFYPDFQTLANQSFPDINITYVDEILTVEGALQSLFIGGDHIYLGNLVQNESLTAVASVNQINLQLYPNPTTEWIRLIGDDLSGTNFQIIDSKGSVWAVGKIKTEDFRLDVSHLPKGVFWLSISKNQQRLFTRAITKF